MLDCGIIHLTLREAIFVVMCTYLSQSHVLKLPVLAPKTLLGGPDSNFYQRATNGFKCKDKSRILCLQIFFLFSNSKSSIPSSLIKSQNWIRNEQFEKGRRGFTSRAEAGRGNICNSLSKLRRLRQKVSIKKSQESISFILPRSLL